MFDLFNRRKLRELEARITAQTDTLEFVANERDRLRDDNSTLRATLREQDQRIWQMGQMTSWNNQRPIFAILLEDTNFRKTAESKRIGSIIHSELAKGTY